MTRAMPPTPLSLDEYDAIEEALLSSARGRWFLAEHADRNRAQDTQVLLEAIAKLERAVLQPAAQPSTHQIRWDLIEMSEAIARTHREIAAIDLPDAPDRRPINPTSELDAIVAVTEKATSDILERAEEIQEIAWLLRESETDPAVCDRLEQRATDIYTACSFQDITGQRTEKVVQVLRFLESRLKSIIEIWGLESPGGADTTRMDTPGLDGAPRQGQRLGQREIDHMIFDGDFDIIGVDSDPDADLDAQAPGHVAPQASWVEAPEPDDTEPAPPQAHDEPGDSPAPKPVDVEDLDADKVNALFS